MFAALAAALWLAVPASAGADASDAARQAERQRIHQMQVEQLRLQQEREVFQLRQQLQREQDRSMNMQSVPRPEVPVFRPSIRAP